MKKFLKIITICFIYFIGVVNVQALTGVVNVNDSLTLRDSPSVGGAKITHFYNNTELTILDTNAGSGNGCSKWYKVTYGGYTGYSCGEYIILKQESIPSIDAEDDSYIRSNYNNKPAGD